MLEKLIANIVKRVLPGILEDTVMQVVRLNKDATYLLVVPEEDTAVQLAQALRVQFEKDPTISKRILLVAASEMNVIEIIH